MKPDFALVLFMLITPAVASVINAPRQVKHVKGEHNSDEHELYKRRGGGKGGWRGGSSGRGGGSSEGSSAGENSRGSSNKGPSDSFRSGSSGNGGSSHGRGSQPTFCGGQYYPGGSTIPYNAGDVSPGGVTPYMIGGAALAFWPGTWLYGAYLYRYMHTYHYHNETSDEREERGVLCGCSQYECCACDYNNNTQYFNELIGNGSYDGLNKSIVNVAEINGTVTILINGTLPNNTALPDDKASDSAASRRMVGASHYLLVTAAVIAAAIVA
ncbi:hypothetical protein Focb16_v006071 [Fusarium oxysporum f. sp. cubense]|uniref:DUF7732 domain-containing protein n=2 Tax=Fusarium oxysporum f. sp. cubense TaxID=61366 RepID=N4U871_FUSC1|nr:hypothetical protein FOC1_g10001070 [Fusarium oxysporum f. sp. cubense race 1]TVY75507.1 hypothetical protein Focb16_v006071 [Fusarium oxysporum f. sp. cubense]